MEDPTRKIIDLPEFSVDKKGRPFIKLVEWTRLFVGQPYTKRATIDAPIQTIEEVLKFSAEAQKKRKKLEEEYSGAKEKEKIEENRATGQ